MNGNKNIILFNSSDDEFAALGDEFKNDFFVNQNEGLDFLADIVGKTMPGYNLVIRMHPNLKDVHFEYVENIKKLHLSYPNVIVVEPESKVDSYSLMEKADKVISFGSTTGLEASYWGIPVILLGKCFYYYSDVAYVPGGKYEIEKLLKEQLTPKPPIDA